MSDPISTNWRVLFWTGSRESRSQMTVKSRDWSAKNITESPAPTFALVRSECHRFFLNTIDNVIFRPVMWLIGGRL